MMRILLPVDDSAESQHAVAAFLQRLHWYRDTPDVHLLNVQTPLRGDITRFLKADLVEQYHREEGEKAIAAPQRELAAAGVAVHTHVRVGNAADIIVDLARELQCDQIVMGSRGLGAAGGWFLGSVVTRVLNQATVPVLILR